MALFRKGRTPTSWTSLSFQADGLSAVRVSRTAGTRPEVNMASVVPLVDGSLVATLQRMGKDWSGARSAFTTILDQHQYQFLPVDAPSVPPTELKSAISWMVREMLDFPVDEAVIDVLDVPGEKDAAARTRHLYAVVAHGRTIEDRQNLLTKAGIPLTVIDVPEMAQRNVAALVEPSRGMAMLSFDSAGGLFTITHGGELYIARRVATSISDLTGKHAAEAFPAVAAEVQRSLDYFERHFQGVQVTSLVLAPMGETATALAAHLQSELPIAVRCLDLEEIMDLDEAPQLREATLQQELFMTVGAALRHEEKVL